MLRNIPEERRSQANLRLHEFLEARFEVLKNHMAEDSSLLGYHAMSCGKKFPTFRRIVVPLSSESSSSKREDEHTTIT
jgi:hypothetical protein